MSAWLICEPLLTFGGSRGLSCPKIYWLGHSLKCIHWHLFILSWPSSLVWQWRLFLYLRHVQKGKLKLSPTYHCHWLQDQKKKLCFRHRAQWNDLISNHQSSLVGGTLVSAVTSQQEGRINSEREAFLCGVFSLCFVSLQVLSWLYHMWNTIGKPLICP